MKDPDDLTRMYEVANVDELALLDTLRIRCGLIWKCSGCGLSNAGAIRWCDGCRQPRADLGIDPNRVAYDVAGLIENFDGFRVGSHVPATDFLEQFCSDVLPHFQRERSA